MEKIIDSKLFQKMREAWGLKHFKAEDDGTKYKSQDPESWVHTDATGVVRMRELMDLEYRGAVVYQNVYGKDEWRIKCDTVIVDMGNIDQFCKKGDVNCPKKIGDSVQAPTLNAKKFFEDKKGEAFKATKESREEIDSIAEMEDAEIIFGR